MIKNLDILSCPSCGSLLNQTNKSLLCKNNHCFDMAKECYVNLLLANMKKTKMPGDDKLMVAARKAFLEKDYYKKLKDEIREIILNYKPNVLLDAGCGTGYYTNELNCKGINIIGVDISKHAVQYASKNNKEHTYLVSSIFCLPVTDSAVDMILNIFAPKPQEEFKRVLKCGGTIIEVVPGERHLKELKQTLYKENYRDNKEKCAFDTFKLVQTKRILYKQDILEQEDVINLLKMTPYWYKGGEKNLSLLNNVNLYHITLDFIINVWEKI